MLWIIIIAFISNIKHKQSEMNQIVQLSNDVYISISKIDT